MLAVRVRERVQERKRYLKFFRATRTMSFLREVEVANKKAKHIQRKIRYNLAVVSGVFYRIKYSISCVLERNNGVSLK